MAEQTPNYGLTKPELEEFYDVGVQNSNMDIIDSALKNSEQQLTEHLAEITWNEITLLNGWEPYEVGYRPKYTIDKHNNLIIKGSIKNGVTTRGTTLFELPINARPEVFRQLLVVNNNQSFDYYQSQPVEISINPNGQVLLGINVPYTQLLSFDEIRIQM